MPESLLAEGRWSLAEERTETLFRLPTVRVQGHTVLYEDTDVRERVAAATADHDGEALLFYASVDAREDGVVVRPRHPVQRRVGEHRVERRVGADCVDETTGVTEAGVYNVSTEGFLDQKRRVVIEDEVTLGANVTIDRGMFADTRLKTGCRIDNLSHIAHNTVIGEYAVMAAFAGISGSVTIGRGAQLGGRVGIADHLEIGEGARLAADAAIMRSVPSGEMWAGSPAQPMREFMRETAWVRRESARARKRKKSDPQ